MKNFLKLLLLVAWTPLVVLASPAEDIAGTWRYVSVNGQPILQEFYTLYRDDGTCSSWPSPAGFNTDKDGVSSGGYQITDKEIILEMGRGKDNPRAPYTIRGDTLVMTGRGGAQLVYVREKTPLAPGRTRRPSVPPPTSTRPDALPPVLAYDEPADYYRGASQSPIEYMSSTVNAGVQVYDFRAFTGDIAAAFRTNLLRDWIDPRYQEGPISGPPEISGSRVPGATQAMLARFHETIAGMPNERMRVRLLIVVGNLAAVIDVQANSSYSWQKASPAILVMLNSIRVERAAALPPAAPASPTAQAAPAAGASLAGLFMGMTQKWSALTHMTAMALYYYAFSPDGRVYRCYDYPPGGNDNAWRTFDFNAAQRSDPVNTGRYTVRGNQVSIQLGSGSITGTLRDANTVVIQGVTYERQP